MLKYACGNEVRVGDTAFRFDSNDGVLDVGEYVVKRLADMYSITIDVNGKDRNFSAIYFNLISRKGETPVKQTFTKKDLKTGYRLILEDGEVAIVFMDSDITSTSYSRDWIKYINHSNGFDDLAYWNDDLTPAEYTSCSRVVEVVKPKHCVDVFKLECEVDIIWKREAPKSKEQIAYDEAVEATEAARQAYELAQKILEKHNTKRTTHINLDIQQKTGNTVKLLPITKVKELTWSVK